MMERSEALSLPLHGSAGGLGHGRNRDKRGGRAWPRLESSRKVFAVFAAASAAVVVAAAAWAFSVHPTEPAFGQRFLMDELPVFPPLGVYFTPATLFVIFGFLAWGCALEALRGQAETVPAAYSRLLVVVFALVALVFGYEVIWNFVMWSAAHVLSPSVPVDNLSNSLDPSITLPRDYAYVTKVDSLYVAVSLYTILFLSTLKRRTGLET